EVAQAAVDELRRRARGRAAEVAPVDERDVEPVARGHLGDPRPDDPAADHEQVEAARPEPLDRLYAVHSGFVQARLPARPAASTGAKGVPTGRRSRTAVSSPSASRSSTSIPCG